MEISKTKLRDCIVIKPDVYSDNRGCFFEAYKEDLYKKRCGIKEKFVQDNMSQSEKNVLRGLHFQKNNPQGKLVTVTSGVVFDVAVDLRPNSKTYGMYESLILSNENKLQFYIPPGFAHGFFVLSDYASFFYKCTNYYDSSDEGGIIWNDKSLNINWPVSNPILSKKDLSLESFSQFTDRECD